MIATLPRFFQREEDDSNKKRVVCNFQIKLFLFKIVDQGQN